MNYEFSCPLCEEFEGKFVRRTKLGLQVAIAEHILHSHEEPAGLRAVNRARLECTDANCSLGCRKQYDPASANNVPKLTEYDHCFLAGIRVKLE